MFIRKRYLAAAATLSVAASAIMFAASASGQSSDGCQAPPSAGRSIGRSILGRVIGDAAGRATNNLGYAARFVPSAEVADTLTNAIACHLDEQEQMQARDATIEATRGGAVGSSSNWNSNSRANVSGTSTVVARDDMGGGSSCMLVDDIVIVNGEEHRAQKRMCRVPPATRYTLAT